jgi:RNA polymerase sigma-70 factor (ECF subfamily)
MVRCELSNTEPFYSATQASDEELIERCRKEADPEIRASLVNELFRRHYHKVSLWCLRLAGNRDLAADWAQDVLLKAFRGLDTFKGGSKFSTWLYTVARNHCYTQIAHRADSPTMAGDVDEASLTESGDNPYQVLERKQTKEYVMGLIADSLDETELTVMSLHYAQGIPLDAVSRMLQLENTSGAKAYIVSAKRKLTRALERAESRFQDRRRREQGDVRSQ